jgi:cation:H+ antiporter
VAAAPTMSLRRSLGVFALGAALVIGGSRLLSDNALILATRLGVPPMIIGLTLVAFGTSLPELVTAITAARKGVPELSLGNIIGANILNITLVTGTAATITPLTMTRKTQAYNFPAMVGVFVLLLVLARTGRRLTRKEGWALIVFYAVYLVGLILLRE